MKHKHSLETRVLAMVLCIMMVLGMLPPSAVHAETGMVAQIGEQQYPTLEDALAAVPSGEGAAKTTITLLDNTSASFDVGNESGKAPQNVVLDLNGKILTLVKAVGSAGTKSSGIRVLANSELTIRNGNVVCSSAVADNIKVGIANYGALVLENVKVNGGELTMYTVNNRGSLTLKGKTEIYNGTGAKFQAAVTNDPYEYVYTNRDAVFNAADSGVFVESVLVERYDRSGINAGGVVLNISAGTYGKIVEDGNSVIPVTYNVSGATIQVATAEQLRLAVAMASAGENPVTIKMTEDISTSFDIGNASGTAPQNIVLDLNEKTLTLVEAVGSSGTKSSGIRVLAKSALTIRNGNVVCSSEVADNIKVGIANYGTLALESVKVNGGALTMYTVNNRGSLTLKGKTEIYNGTGANAIVAITNDPYDAVYTDRPAELNCDDSGVYVESVLVERYTRIATNTNKAGVVLNISAGTFGKIVEDGDTAIPVTYNVSGATIQVATAEQLRLAVDMASTGESPVTIKMTEDIAASFDIGNASGTAPQNLVLDLNEKTLTLVEAVGSSGTKSSGIRVLAKSALTIRNGNVVCSSEVEDNIKVGIANYGTLVLENVKVHGGDLTMYTVNNRGSLTLKGQTEIYKGTGENAIVAITNDPYDAVYTDFPAVLNCDDSGVYVESVLVERYARRTTNAAGVELNITAGTFGNLSDDGKTDRPADYRITGGTFGNDITAFLNTEDYECVEQDGQYVVTFIKKDQTGFGFANAGPVELTYSEGLTYENIASGGSVADGVVTYAVVEEGSTPGAATVDANGLVTILKAGTVIIEATKTGDETYLDAVARYELKIAPGAREASFGTAFVDVVYGTPNYTNDTLNISVQGSSTKVAYSIVSGGEIATVNSETGELTFADKAVGTVEVKANVYGDDCYADCEATFKVAVKWLQPENAQWDISCDNIGTNGWYKSNVTLTAPEGYTIGTSNSLNSEDWNEVLVFAEEGITELDLYLKNEQGHMTNAIPFAVKIDKTAPIVEIEYVKQEQSSLKEWLGRWIFGSNKQVKIVFHVTGDDIAAVEWSKDGGENYETLYPENGEYSVTIDSDYRGYVCARVTDKAGWTVEIQPDGTLVLVDQITPELSVNFREGENGEAITEFPRDSEDFMNSSAEAFYLDFLFADNNFDLTIITVDIERLNGADQKNVELAWTPAGDNSSATATLALTERDEYTITATFQDPVNEGSRTYKVRLYNGDPVLKAETASEDKIKNTIGATDYYNSADGVKVQLSVSDDFFAKCESGVIVNGKYQVIPVEDWNRNAQTGAYTTVLTYQNEGTYEIQAYYKTAWNGEKTSDVYSFVLDTTAPTVEGLSYEEITEWERFFGELFGFYNGDLTAKVVDAEDPLAGVAKVEFSLNGDDNYETVAASDEGYVFTVKPEYRGKINLRITDNAGNSMVYSESRIVVLDTIAPQIAGIEYKCDENGKIIKVENDPFLDVSTTANDFRVVFTIVEDNLDVAPEQPKIYYKQLNDTGDWMEPVEGAVPYSDNNHTVEFAMTAANGIGDGTYRVKIVVQDHFSTVEEEVYVKIDRTAPEIDTQIQQTANNTDENGWAYYSTDEVNLGINITEENFKAENVNVKVNYSPVADGPFEELDSYAKEVQDKDKWESIGFLNQTSLDFENEGFYEVSIVCTDSLGTIAKPNANGTNNVIRKFVIDRTAPEASMTYKEEPTLIETLKGWFGFRDDTITVNLNVADQTAGVNTVQVSVDGVNFADAEKDGEQYVFTVEDRYQDQLTLRVVDMAGNETKVLEDKALVVDKAAPGITVSMQSDSFEQYEDDGPLYTNHDPFNFWMMVEDADTYDLFDDWTVITDNGVPMTGITWENTDTDGKALIEVGGQGQHVLYTNINTGLHFAEWTQTVIVDTTNPVIDIAFSGDPVQNHNGYDHYDATQTVTITIDEVNFKAEDVDLQMTAERVALDEEGNPVELPDYSAIAKNPEYWTTKEGTSERVLVLEVAADAAYELTVDYADLATNPAETKSAKFVVDTVKPTVDTVTYSKNAIEEILEDISFGFFVADVDVQVTASDHTAGVQSVEYWVEGTESNGSTEEVKLNGILNADENGEFETFSLPAKFSGKVYTQATDYSHNVGDKTNVAADDDDDGELIEHVIVDAVAPVLTPSFAPAGTHNETVYFNDTAVLELTVEEANFYKELFTTVVTTTAAGYTVSEWSGNGTTHKQTVTMREDAEYVVQVTGADYSGNKMDTYTTPTMVVDTTPPELDVKLYAADEQGEFDMTKEAVGNTYEGDSTVYFDSAIMAVITITERNFCAEEVVFNLKGEDPLGNPLNFTIDPAKWQSEGDTHVYEVVFTVDGTYELDVDYTDLATNPGNDVAKLEFDVDKVNPDIVVEGLENGSFNQEAQTATIKITDANFLPDAEHLSYTITAVDSTGADVQVEFPDLYQKENWTNTEDSNEWVAVLDFTVEANYNIALSYTDLSGREGYVHGAEQSKLTVYEAAFTVDNSLPVELTIDYAEPAGILDGSVYYYNAPAAEDFATLTLTARDVTSGLDYFILDVKREGLKAATTIELPTTEDIIGEVGELKGFTVVSVENSNGLMVVKLQIPAQFSGKISFRAFDKAVNSEYCAAEKTIVVDSTAPVLTAETAPTQILNAENQAVVTMPEDGNAANMDNVVLYYADQAQFTFTMTEANFIAVDVIFTVNEVPQELNWTAEEGSEIYKATWNSTGDGDYVLHLSYTDRSGNEKAVYDSQRIVVDSVAPVMNVDFTEVALAQVTADRDYYNADRYATITIVDENFRAEDVQIQVEAKNVAGATVGDLPDEYTARGKTQNAAGADEKELWSAYTDTKNWRREDNEYTIVIPFTTDANYTFSVSYKDLVLKEAESYEAKAFTVDKTAPVSLNMSYEKAIIETIIEGITFGYYDAQLNVTITAEDETSGIDHFVYSYINHEGVSSVNAELLNQKLAVASYDSDNRKATATFTIPQSALGKNNQFKGNIQFDAYDRSTNVSHMKNETGVVVDNISPTASVSFNEPAQTVNGTEYYNGSVNGRIVITEANFFSSDVQVVVTRDGVRYDTRVNWTDNSVDEHVGTFTLSQEGDYVVTINYSDKSNNRMVEYKSATKVVDLEAPSIKVSNVVADSANDEDVYTFTITVEDADGNLRADDIKPTLTGVFRNSDGTHTTEEIELGDVTVVSSGKTFTYTVQDLPKDGIYTLTCIATDLAKNGTSDMVLDDGTAHTEVRFSINRDGSTFAYGNDETRILAENYYVQRVGHDLVIHEVNVDPINTYTVTMNGKELTEGEGFTTTLSGGDNKWSLREYVIKAELFAGEGEYSVVVSSVDATNATAYSDVRNLNMSFVVDTTEPVIIIGGLKDEGRYQTEKQVVTMYPSDEGGSLQAVTVELYKTNDNPGEDEPVSILFDMADEKLHDYLLTNGGKIEFEVPEGYRHTVRVVCTDYAVDDDGNVNTYTQILKDITVSPSGFMMFYANKSLFYGTIGGVAAILALILFLIFKKKSKKEDPAA